ncbi:hypothetical protein COLO4_02798 [Corchorus olitorius]|uniref:Uncharacterized protein n=1 Tax=Corchorus olitorius TaxID=93759 RepID=A0A1R3L073_9ROSI|nr:hypothetical protein COLO4_02798 [Corchorus olitorius]
MATKGFTTAIMAIMELGMVVMAMLMAMVTTIAMLHHASNNNNKEGN